MRVELSRYRVKPGKSARVNEWLDRLNARMNEVLETLDREQMKLEVIFRELIGDDEYLYWFSVQDEAGEPLESSPFDVDAEHMAFFEECLDHDYGRRDAQPQVVMVPPVVAKAMAWRRPASDRVAFERRTIRFSRIE